MKPSSLTTAIVLSAVLAFQTGISECQESDGRASGAVDASYADAQADTVTDTAASREVNTYVVPAITNEFILPNSPISHILSIGTESRYIAMAGCSGEFEPASFVLRGKEDLSSVQVVASDLTGPAGTIPLSNVDIRVVKSWWVAGTLGIARQYEWNLNDPSLAPELLLKNDDFIRVENGRNYILQTDGQHRCISNPGEATPSDLSLQDSDTLQPVDIAENHNKQFWITVDIPQGTAPGTYSGTVSVSNTTRGKFEQLQVDLEVLNIHLPDSPLIYSIYYIGKLQEHSATDFRSKNEEQYRLEMRNLMDHGVRNPAIYQSFDQAWLGKVLEMRTELGMGGLPLYYLGLRPWGHQPPDQVEEVVALARSYGVPDVYFYGEDEAKGSELDAQRSSWQAIHAAGGKVFAACYAEDALAHVGDLLDLPILHCGDYFGNHHPVYGDGGTDGGDMFSHATMEYYRTEAANWHAAGQQAFAYANPQVGIEQPETYRRNYGLWLWQAGFDGVAAFAYQYYDPWNDFWNSSWKAHNFTYTTSNGVVDTIEWEGFREGVDDTRYMAALQFALEAAQTDGKDTSEARAWIDNLKASDLYGADLYAVRSEMIDLILDLQ